MRVGLQNWVCLLKKEKACKLPVVAVAVRNVFSSNLSLDEINYHLDVRPLHIFLCRELLGLLGQI